LLVSRQHDLSALHIAAWKGHVHVVQILIAEGSALDQKSKVLLDILLW